MSLSPIIRKALGFRTWAVVAFIGGMILAGRMWKSADAPPSAKFILDMTVPPLRVAPWSIDLYLNGFDDPPTRVPVRGGTRSRYEISCQVRAVHFVRLDPVQVTGVEVAIHSLAIEVNGT